MKKLTAIVLVLMMLFGLTALAEADLTGEWYANMFGLNVTLTLGADGSIGMFADGIEDPLASGEWELEGDTLYLNRGLEDEGKLTVTEEGLFESESNTMFTRDPNARVAVGSPVAANSVSDFDGNWTCIALQVMGVTLDLQTAMEQLGDQLGTVNFDITINNGSVNAFGAGELAYTFTDGTLVFSLGDSEIDLTQTIVLNDDGTMTYSTMGMNYIYAKN